MTVTRVLIVRLPCQMVFDTGPLYLLSLLHRAAPRIQQRFLSLALVDTSSIQRSL
jgi:hypothetical protein